MSRHDAVKALDIYKRAGQQVFHCAFFPPFFLGKSGSARFLFHFFALFMCCPLLCLSRLMVIQAESLAEFYEYCKGLDLARNFQFPTLRQVINLPLSRK